MDIQEYWGMGCCFNRCMKSKQCKDYYLDQQFCWVFYRYAVGEVWDNKGGLGSSAKVIHTIKFYKTVSIREWHTSSTSKEYEYSRVLFCYDRSLGSILSYKIGRTKGM
jgi:hypothetical protein